MILTSSLVFADIAAGMADQMQMGMVLEDSASDHDSVTRSE